jgi:hypothetical protein
MRDDSDEVANARRPVLALVFLAGIAAVLSFSATSREFLDDPAVDGALVPVLAFLGGGMYGFAGYWIGVAALYLGIRGAKGEGSYRSARHILAYSLAPLARLPSCGRSRRLRRRQLRSGSDEGTGSGPSRPRARLPRLVAGRPGDRGARVHG